MQREQVPGNVVKHSALVAPAGDLHSSNACAPSKLTATISFAASSAAAACALAPITFGSWLPEDWSALGAALPNSRQGAASNPISASNPCGCNASGWAGPKATPLAGALVGGSSADCQPCVSDVGGPASSPPSDLVAVLHGGVSTSSFSYLGGSPQMSGGGPSWCMDWQSPTASYPGTSAATSGTYPTTNNIYHHALSPPQHGHVQHPQQLYHAPPLQMAPGATPLAHAPTSGSQPLSPPPGFGWPPTGAWGAPNTLATGASGLGYQTAGVYNGCVSQSPSPCHGFSYGMQQQLHQQRPTGFWLQGFYFASYEHLMAYRRCAIAYNFHFFGIRPHFRPPAHLPRPRPPSGTRRGAMSPGPKGEAVESSAATTAAAAPASAGASAAVGGASAAATAPPAAPSAATTCGGSPVRSSAEGVDKGSAEDMESLCCSPGGSSTCDSDDTSSDVGRGEATETDMLCCEGQQSPSALFRDQQPDLGHDSDHNDPPEDSHDGKRANLVHVPTSPVGGMGLGAARSAPCGQAPATADRRGSQPSRLCPSRSPAEPSSPRSAHEPCAATASAGLAASPDACVRGAGDKDSLKRPRACGLLTGVLSPVRCPRGISDGCGIGGSAHGAATVEGTERQRPLLHACAGASAAGSPTACQCPHWLEPHLGGLLGSVVGELLWGSGDGV